MMRIYFGKVFIDGLESVPKDKPLILAANHQSAFIEPVLLGGIMPFPVHFITRGDIFVKRWMWFFNAVNMVPIFRFHDGFSQMKKNMNSFQHVYDALNKGARVIIFCEGQMKWEKKLHSLQLGASRMAIGAYEQYRELDIYVVPIGINYEDHLTFRRYVRISFGEAIRLTDHTAELDKSQRPALRSVTKELATRLQPEIIHIGSEEHYDLANTALAMHDNNETRTFFPFIEYNKGTTKHSVSFAQNTIKLDTDSNLVNKLTSYTHALGDHFQHKDYVLKNPDEFSGLKALWFYLIVVPIGGIGILLNGLPIFLGGYITKISAKVPEFVGALKSNVSAFCYLFYVLIIVGILLVFDWQVALIALAGMLVTGLFATYLWDRWPYWKAKRQVGKIGESTKEKLLNSREEILNSIQHDG